MRMDAQGFFQRRKGEGKGKRFVALYLLGLQYTSILGPEGLPAAAATAELAEGHRTAVYRPL